MPKIDAMIFYNTKVDQSKFKTRKVNEEEFIKRSIANDEHKKLKDGVVKTCVTHGGNIRNKRNATTTCMACTIDNKGNVVVDMCRTPARNLNLFGAISKCLGSQAKPLVYPMVSANDTTNTNAARQFVAENHFKKLDQLKYPNAIVIDNRLFKVLKNAKN